jgi:hypothetical protein
MRALFDSLKVLSHYLQNAQKYSYFRDIPPANGGGNIPKKCEICAFCNSIVFLWCIPEWYNLKAPYRDAPPPGRGR